MLVKEQTYNKIQKRYKNLNNVNKTPKIVWINVAFYISFHFIAVYGLYLFIFVISWKTFIWGVYLLIINVLGTTAGCHRLWAHRSYRANWKLKILLVYSHTSSCQPTIYNWVRNHRLHHIFKNTDIDPYNSTEGFFHSHICWMLFQMKNISGKLEKCIDMSDLDCDDIIMFQKKYYLVLMPLLTFVIPIIIPYLWQEPLLNIWCTIIIFRCILTINIILSMNSIANFKVKNCKTYNTRNAIKIWNNFHHKYPFDYRTSEFYGYGSSDITTAFIDFMARLGWAYDLKTMSLEIILKKLLKKNEINLL